MGLITCCLNDMVATYKNMIIIVSEKNNCNWTFNHCVNFSCNWTLLREQTMY